VIDAAGAKKVHRIFRRGRRSNSIEALRRRFIPADRGKPCPSYEPFPGALAEYNGKFMDNQRVPLGGKSHRSRSIENGASTNNVAF
jgi:hypothetical protein